VNRLVFFIIILFLLNSCSKDKELNDFNNIESTKDKSIEKLFAEKKTFSQELNPDLKLDLKNVKINNKISNKDNDYGFQKYNGAIKKILNYKFSKFNKNKKVNLNPLFLSNGIIFFDKKGAIIRFNNNGKIAWKKNFYSKSEKKLEPKLSFANYNELLIVTDNIAKYYSVNINTGEINWIKNNTYPFNSEIKVYKNKFFVIDYKNILRCFNLSDGSKCWSLQTEDSFTISDIKFSLVIVDDLIVFSNSIGDITAVDIETGLIRWQLPTQKSSIINETYNFKNSKLVSDSNSLFFSNNKNQFYSVDMKTGVVNWINKINSHIMPILSGDLIFTISNNGFLYVIEKQNGNIIRINDLYKVFKNKEREKIFPTGFVIGSSQLYLSNNNGKMIVVDVSDGDILKIEKISGDFISKPFIFNNNLFVVKNGSIVKYE
tara:strand:- start:314 stop:1606 length:1293 start_codon:yes stop_codon:yes gene_type:complete